MKMNALVINLGNVYLLAPPHKSVFTDIETNLDKRAAKKRRLECYTYRLSIGSDLHFKSHTGLYGVKSYSIARIQNSIGKYNTDISYIWNIICEMAF